MEAELLESHQEETNRLYKKIAEKEDDLTRTADTLEKTLMLGKIEGGRRRGLQDEMVGWHH